MLRALVVASIALASVAHAERPMCRPGMTYHGKTLDLDVKDADVEEVIRLLADVAGINIVVADGVQGKVTFKVKHVAWDALLCTIAGMHKLTVTVDGNIVLVKQ